MKSGSRYGIFNIYILIRKIDKFNRHLRKVRTMSGISDTTARIYLALAPFFSPFEFITARDPKIRAPTSKESRISGKAAKEGTRPLM